MNLIPVAAFVFLLLLTTTPDESKAGVSISWFVKIAKELGVKLAKRSFYARCLCRGVPSGISCPSVVFGVGLSRQQAQAAAKVFAIKYVFLPFLRIVLEAYGTTWSTQGRDPSFLNTMKLIPVAVFVFLLVLATVPDESEAVPPAWFAAIAAKLGVRLLKNAYYARCNTRYVPPGIRCPSVVYGMGWSRGSAQSSARVYASTFGDSRCGRYLGHCQIYRYRRGRGK
ncbi:hypothetical protein ACROYT_G009044 [Oculina patagonica]